MLNCSVQTVEDRTGYNKMLIVQELEVWYLLRAAVGDLLWELRSVGRLPSSSYAGKMDEAFIP